MLLVQESGLIIQRSKKDSTLHEVSLKCSLYWIGLELWYLNKNPDSITCFGVLLMKCIHKDQAREI